MTHISLEEIAANLREGGHKAEVVDGTLRIDYAPLPPVRCPDTRKAQLESLEQNVQRIRAWYGLDQPVNRVSVALRVAP